MVTIGPDAHSSRNSESAAGWSCSQIGSFQERMPARTKRLSWFNPRMLWRSRNDVLARHLTDPVARKRAAIVGGRTDAELTVDLSDRLSDFSFLVLGDTGEGDASQYALTTPVNQLSDESAFMFICSDVLYPIGDINQYENKFYRPYADYRQPIYAIPGNHDWYDDLEAFLFHLCGRSAPPDQQGRSWRQLSTKAGWSRLLWRLPATPNATRMAQAMAARTIPQPITQPGPYYVIDTAHLRLVGIDTGIRGCLDKEQGEWLARVSRDPRPKVLLTGSPIWVDGEHHPCPIEGGAAGFQDVDAIVRRPEHNYVAAIGGDVHNYQHYPVRVDGGRTIDYVVSGGGGAFMHATHTIPPMDECAVPGVAEEDFRCYPLRPDSLAAYSVVLDRKLGKLLRGRKVKLFTLTPSEAATYLVEHRKVRVHREHEHVALDKRALRAARIVFLIRGRQGFHKWFSPFLDWDEPPFFKQFLRLDVEPDSLRIRCFGVNGCREREKDPTLEDDIRIALSGLEQGNGRVPEQSTPSRSVA